MSLSEVFDALGGGLVGLLGVAVLGLWYMVLRQYDLRIKERDTRIIEQAQEIKDLRSDNKELRGSVTRLADVVEAWTPDAQRRGRLRQP